MRSTAGRPDRRGGHLFRPKPAVARPTLEREVAAKVCSDSVLTAAVGREVGYASMLLDLASYFLVFESQLTKGFGVDSEAATELGVLTAEGGNGVVRRGLALGVSFRLRALLRGRSGAAGRG